jgi:dTDP-4-amino-4,6-dideoxygalactose transaminase
MAVDIPSKLSTYLGRIGDLYYYDSASQALKDVLVWLNNTHPKQQPNVVMPTYESSSLYKTTLASGYVPKFYEIYDGCRFDLEEIKNLIDENTRAILVIHYFGQPADILPLRQLADRTGKYLIEDCALSLAGSVNGIPLGAIGDCSIFSARKMLTLPNGGILVMSSKNETFKPKYEGRAKSTSSLLYLLLSRLKYVYFMLTGSADPLHIAKLPKSGHIDPKAKQVLEVKEMSRLSRFWLDRIHLRKQVLKRRKNYLRLLEAIKEFPFVKPLRNDPPQDWTPYTLPIRVSSGDRDAVRARLLEHGVACGCGWPESPYDPKHKRARELAGEILELPVHPLMTLRQLNSIPLALRDFYSDQAEGAKRGSNHHEHSDVRGN